jgi:hypothetical protein
MEKNYIIPYPNTRFRDLIQNMIYGMGIALRALTSADVIAVVSLDEVKMEFHVVCSNKQIFGALSRELSNYGIVTSEVVPD